MQEQCGDTPLKFVKKLLLLLLLSPIILISASKLILPLMFSVSDPWHIAFKQGLRSSTKFSTVFL